MRSNRTSWATWPTADPGPPAWLQGATGVDIPRRREIGADTNAGHDARKR